MTSSHPQKSLTSTLCIQPQDYVIGLGVCKRRSLFRSRPGMKRCVTTDRAAAKEKTQGVADHNEDTESDKSNS